MLQISIIIPTFNRASLLNRAINSILAQTYTHWDLWVIDDGSTDNTASLVEEFQHTNPKLNIRYVRSPNLGVSHARNLGAQLSTSSWIAFLDSDDEWLSSKLELQVHAIKNTNSPLIHGHEKWQRNHKDVKIPKKYQKLGGRIFKENCDVCAIGPSCALIRKDIFSELGGFNEEFQVCEDVELWLRICSKYDTHLVDEDLIIKHGGHQDQLSMQHHSMDEWRLKALLPHINSPLLTADENIHLKEVCLKKGQILLSGLLKYDHLEQHHVWEKRLNLALGVSF